MPSNRELSQFGGYVNVDDASKLVGITTNTLISGIVTATAYYGDGSNLTGILTPNDIVGIDTLGTSNFANVFIIGITSTGRLRSGDIFSTGIVTATTFFGNLTGNVTGNVTGNLTGEVNSIAFDTNPNGIVVTGIATASSFSGSGTRLTGIVTSIIPGTNVSLSTSFGAVTINADIGVSSQWETVSVGINTLSNVGVGTTNPTSKLTVRGDVAVNNGSLTVGSAVTVSSTGLNVGFGTIRNLNIQNYAETVNALGNTGVGATINLANGNFVTATLTGNCTFTFTPGITSNAISFTLFLTNDGTAGRSIIWPPSVKWPNNNVPSRTTDANKTDVWSFFTFDGGTNWYGNLTLFNYST
jgi:hypothetical protein